MRLTSKPSYDNFPEKRHLVSTGGHAVVCNDYLAQRSMPRRLLQILRLNCLRSGILSGNRIFFKSSLLPP
ncbi:MAG: hypothetical protein ACTS73_04950 [Arsenophonus sp. NEOnobi-MAG3]